MLSTRDVLARLTEIADRDDIVTYRKLDYLARAGRGTDLANARGSGTRRSWDPDLVARLEVATALATRHQWLPWGHWAGLVVGDGAPSPLPEGWVLIDDLAAVHYVATTAELAALIGRGDGGTFARYALTPVEAEETDSPAG